MSESAKTIIKYFCDRYLDIDFYPTTLKSILDLEISKLKKIEEEDIDKFKKIKLFNLRDLSMVPVSDYEKLSKKAQINNITFKKALIAALLIANSWSKRAQYLKKPKMKVVVAGLNYAGKTSLINRLINDINYNDMFNLEPTIGANVEEYQSEKIDLILWDLGGQKDNIDEYLESPERFFVQVDVLIFVVDSQDDVRYVEAVKYLNDLTNILAFLNENPYFVVLLNKADSDVVNDPDFQIKVEYLTDKISDVFMKSEKSWNFDITPTSIYNFYSSEPDIAKSIKNIFSKDKSELDSSKILPNIEEKLQKILDINLKLMDKVVVELSELRRAVVRISPSDISQSLFSVPFEKVPLGYISDNQSLGEKPKKKKKKGKTEDPIKKVKRTKGAAGPPKRLKEMKPPETGEIKNGEGDKISNNKIVAAKTALSSNTQVETPPVAPRTLDNSGFATLESLKPPPPPPKPSVRVGGSSASARSEIISELKDMFVKRGLVTR
ncbi:MAG: 50S ribosome-binding GTPase [Candidatus Lokiarchaeota archaeon]|nr:50S ribosome-binding GTPase [Candidatus Lokiarchaeota archaeon]